MPFGSQSSAIIVLIAIYPKFNVFCASKVITLLTSVKKFVNIIIKQDRQKDIFQRSSQKTILQFRALKLPSMHL